MKKTAFFWALAMAMIPFKILHALTDAERKLGFVYLDEIAPDIEVSLRYATDENFVGKPVDGYQAGFNRAIMTKETAQALAAVQKAVNKEGFSLVVYDATRPQKAVDHFMRWSIEISDQEKKKEYYPHIHKKDVFKLGYIAEKSGHSRGSTVDVTIIELDKEIHPIRTAERLLLDGRIITYLDDGTLDMGSSFDLFDEASHHENNLLGQQYKDRRMYLRKQMEKAGFEPCAKEWWHYTLKNERFARTKKSSYHNFDIR